MIATNFLKHPIRNMQSSGEPWTRPQPMRWYAHPRSPSQCPYDAGAKGEWRIQS